MMFVVASAPAEEPLSFSSNLTHRLKFLEDGAHSEVMEVSGFAWGVCSDFGTNDAAAAYSQIASTAQRS